MDATVLVVSRETNLSDSVRDAVQRLDGETEVRVLDISRAEEAVQRFAGLEPGLVFLALEQPGMDGLEALRLLRDRGVETPVVLTADRSRAGVAIRSIQVGATDFLVRPVSRDAVEEIVNRHLGRSAGSRALEVAPGAGGEAERLLGRSPGIVEVCKTIGRVAPTDATVLITGESGTGKELVAGLLHENSPRAAGPFRTVNCAAIPDSLLESELFGHERGAFTGAAARQVGTFERADGGTLFLDEVGEMALAHQRKILRALEDRTIERVGGGDAIDVDVRVVAATNVDLWSRVKEGAFRRDLYYRLAVVNVRIPPLRDRMEDLKLLADHFVARFARRSGRAVERVADGVYERLGDYDWPGNVRELRNVLERAVIMGQGPILRVDDLPRLGRSAADASGSEAGTLRRFCREGMSLEALEQRYIENVLQELDWHFGRAADVLQIHRNTLRRKIRRYGLREPG